MPQIPQSDPKNAELFCPEPGGRRSTHQIGRVFELRRTACWMTSWITRRTYGSAQFGSPSRTKYAGGFGARFPSGPLLSPKSIKSL